MPAEIPSFDQLHFGNSVDIPYMEDTNYESWIDRSFYDEAENIRAGQFYAHAQETRDEMRESFEAWRTLNDEMAKQMRERHSKYICDNITDAAVGMKFGGLDYYETLKTECGKEIEKAIEQGSDIDAYLDVTIPISHFFDDDGGYFALDKNAKKVHPAHWSSNDKEERKTLMLLM